MTRFATHETFLSEKAVPGSERSFGIVMAVVLALVAAFNWYYDGRVWPWLGVVAALFAAGALIYPVALKPFNWIWFKFGLLLHAIISPIIMCLLFYVAVWPTGLIMRAFGKDPLRLKREPESSTYWIAREPRGPKPETMKDQF